MNNFSQSAKRAFAQPAFLAAAVVLAICGTVLNFVPLEWVKKPVPLAASSLREGIPEKLGHWVMVTTDHSIDPTMQEVLGTAEYVFRDYVDDRKVSAEVIAQLMDSANTKRDAMLSNLQRANPSQVLRIGVTYYTGAVDTVAHVPDRCYVADGFEVDQSLKKPVTLGTYADGSPRKLSYSYLTFVDQTGVGGGVQRVSRSVGYVFHCNGEYLSSANDVRLKLQNLLEPYGYYAKVEMMTVAHSANGGGEAGATISQDESAAAMEDFLGQALPAVEKCLTNWQELHKPKK